MIIMILIFCTITINRSVIIITIMIVTILTYLLGYGFSIIYRPLLSGLSRTQVYEWHLHSYMFVRQVTGACVCAYVCVHVCVCARLFCVILSCPHLPACSLARLPVCLDLSTL